MDWLLYATKSLAMHGTSKSATVQYLFVVCMMQLLVAEADSTIWTNLVLKHHDAVLWKVKEISASNVRLAESKRLCHSRQAKEMILLVLGLSGKGTVCS